ncbi:hypothetical protein HYT52_01000 [Candidatus Woesearchaeota archaeon]|nr:hypothetical protein [Candidatus Woesearchaeota archaeon]
MSLDGDLFLDEHIQQDVEALSDLEVVLNRWVRPQQTAYRIFSNDQLLNIANERLAEVYQARKLSDGLKNVILDFRAIAAYIDETAPVAYREFRQLGEALDRSYAWLMECSRKGYEDTPTRERLRLEVITGQEAYYEIEEKLRFYNARTKIIGTFCDRLREIIKGEAAYQPISMVEIKESTREITDRMWPVLNKE